MWPYARDVPRTKVLPASAIGAAADIDWRWIAPRLVLAVFAGYLAFRWGALIVTGHVHALWLKDHDLYMAATRGWLAGGPFYPDWQTSGPYEIRWGAILYPPVALLLFVPFSFLPGWLWVLIPAAVTLAVVAWHRPGPWRLAVIAVVLASNPMEILDYTAGTPTIWIVMFVALATRWPWWSAIVLAKPTLVVFGLIGVRSRTWWVTAVALSVVSLAFWQMTLTWLGVMVDLQGATVLYSVPNVTLLLVPLVAAYPALRGRIGASWFVGTGERESGHVRAAGPLRVRRHVDIAVGAIYRPVSRRP